MEQVQKTSLYGEKMFNTKSASFLTSSSPPDTFSNNTTNSSPSNTDTDAKHKQTIKFTSVSRFTSNDNHREDWREAPHLGEFYGREQECLALKQWIVDDQCRLVAVLGIGGIGKTALAATLVGSVKDRFDYVFWRSLQNALPIGRFLEKCILFLSNQEKKDLPGDLDDQISLLVTYLQDHRCLIVLDNLETVLQGGNRTGQYRTEYEGYGQLIQRIGETLHQSCLLLTSREKPKEVARLEGKNAPVRSWQLLGVSNLEGKQLLSGKDLFGTENVWNALIDLYSGNPLALKVVSEFIREVFGGDIAAFLKEDEPVFGDIHDLLKQQFSRLSELERTILFWLAVEREEVSLEDLQLDLISTTPKRELLEALGSLRRRSMIEIGGTAHFKLQPVIMEYVTNRFVEEVSEELEAERIKLMTSHALIKAQAKDYIRDIQIRLILEQVATQFMALHKISGSETKLKKIISALQKTPPQIPGYAAGNVLNLLIQLKIDLHGYDFSHLTILQAYLQGVPLRNVNFAHADLTKSVFADSFGSVFSVAISPDGKLLVAGTGDGELRLWNTVNATPLYTFHGHTDWIRSVVFSPSGNTIASGSEDQTVRLWNVETGECLGILKGHSSRIYAVAFSPDERTLASGSDDHTVRLWDVKTKECQGILRGHKGMVYSVAFSPSGDLVASSSGDQTIRLWDTQVGECIRTLYGHTNRVRSVGFSPDGDMIASGSGDQTIRLWQVDTGACIGILHGHTNWIWSVVFTVDGSKIISGSDDQTIRIWDIRTTECIRTIEAQGSRVYSVAVSSDGNVTASANDGQTIRLWDTNTGECLKTLQGYGSRVYSVAYHPSGNALASGGEDMVVRLWDANTGGCIREQQGQTHWIWSVAFSKDGEILASSSEDRIIQLWNSNTGEKLKVLHGHANRVFTVAFDPKGSVIASGSGDQTVKLWDVNTGECLRTLRGHSGRVYAVAFDYEGKILVSSSDDRTIKLWNISSGECLKTLDGQSNHLRSIAFSPDGRFVAGGSEESVKIWVVNTDECLKTLQGHSKWIWSVAFSPDGSTIASGSEDQSVRLWDTRNGTLLRNFAENDGTVYSVAFSPDGRNIASSSDNGIIKIWDVNTGKCAHLLRSNRPYEGMNISNVRGLSVVQKATLKTLGAIEKEV